MLSPETQSEVRAAIEEGRTLLQRIAAAAPELANLYSMTFGDIVTFPGGAKVHGALVRDRSAAFLADLRAFDELVTSRDPVRVLASAVSADDERAISALQSAKEAEAFIRSVIQLLAGASGERTSELLGSDVPGEGGAAVAGEESLLSAIDWAGLLDTLEEHRMLVSDVTNAAFDAYSAAMGDAIATGHFSAAGIGKALKMSAKESLLSIGRQAMAKGMFELGSSLKAFAHGDNEGGQKHLGVAGKYMAVVAMTGAAAGAMGGGGGRGGKKKGDDEVVPAGAAPSGASSSKPKVIQHLRIIGNPTDDDIEATKKHYRN